MKYKNALTVINETIKNLSTQLEVKMYLEMPEFDMISDVSGILKTIWHHHHVDFSILENIHEETLRLRFGSDF